MHVFYYETNNTSYLMTGRLTQLVTCTSFPFLAGYILVLALEMRQKSPHEFAGPTIYSVL